MKAVRIQGAAYDAGEMALDVDDNESDQQNGEVIH
jgi:hypothetical protein